MGEGTWHVADVVWRLAGLSCAVAGRLWHVSRLVCRVSAPLLHTFFWSPTPGEARRRGSARATTRPARSCGNAITGGTTGAPTYMHQGKQYIVVPVGGTDVKSQFVAFSLP